MAGFSQNRDFIYAGKQKGRKLRHNFSGLQTDELLERMIELTLYTEEHLK